MKKSLIVAGILLAGSSLFAGDGYYVGLGVGNYDFSRSVTKMSTGATGDFDDDGGFQSLTVGYSYKTNFRSGATYYNINDETNLDIYHAQIFTDYIIQNENILKPYIGASIGYLNHKLSGLTSLSHTPDSVEIKGMSYGLRAGILWNINKKLSTDLCFEAKKVQADGSTTGIYSGSKYEWEVDAIKGFSIGLNYKF